MLDVTGSTTSILIFRIYHGVNLQLLACLLQKKDCHVSLLCTLATCVWFVIAGDTTM